MLLQASLDAVAAHLIAPPEVLFATDVLPIVCRLWQVPQLFGKALLCLQNAAEIAVPEGQVVRTRAVCECASPRTLNSSAFRDWVPVAFVFEGVRYLAPERAKKDVSCVRNVSGVPEGCQSHRRHEV